MIDPVDGSTVSDTTLPSTIAFSGVVQQAHNSTPVKLSTVSLSTGATLRTIGSAPIDFTTTYSQWGSKWVPFQGSGSIPASDTLTGATGWAALLRTDSTFGARGNPNFCLGNADNFSEGTRQCANDDTLVCTSNFTPKTVTARRFGCPSPRSVKLNNVAVSFPRGPVTVATTVANSNSDLNDPATTVAVAQRGDKYTFVDLYDADFSDTAHVAQTGSHGAYMTAMQRMPTYNLGVNSASFMAANTLKKSLPVPNQSDYTWRGLKTVKMYDRGACSLTVPWRTILNEFVVQLDDSLRESSPSLIGLYPSSRTSFTPMLRTATRNESQGAFEIVQDVTASGTLFGITGQVRAKMRLVVGITGQNGAVTADIIKFELKRVSNNVVVDLLEATGIVNVDRVLRDASDKLAGELGETLTANLGAAGMLARRVNWRPEGIEYVLAEDTADATYPLLNALGYCNRNAWTSTSSGYVTGLFDPPLSGDPPVFRDSRDPGQRLIIQGTTVHGVLKD